ncbi:hypothetical protein [Hyphomicrobium sp. ghe19]|uniref:hypothetical protein n=1 Tax=Hyphomicrobium sp. ghe19 TaxID=2682968 RepID=UPI00136746C6|nr:hypothetical protein HYPP_02045 [Hyphomicrobium sp. ghe19]
MTEASVKSCGSRDERQRRGMIGGTAALLLVALLSIAGATISFAQEPIPDGPPTGPWGPSIEKRRNTTTVERGKTPKGPGVKFVALLTGDGQQIDQGLVWRVFQSSGQPGKSKLLMESHEASPFFKLNPGEYTVNAAFGRANLTRKIVVKAADGPPFEAFVLNAGGLRLSALIGGKPAPAGLVTYSIFADDRDQFESHSAVITGAKPNLIIRLNSGIYRVVSQYGDANAKIETDITVEAGKLTETTVTHSGGKATFKLVTRSGGEAMPDTRWTIQTEDGETIKESVGALPTHVLAPGKYEVTASSGGHIFQKPFQIKDGDNVNVEVMMIVSHEQRGQPSSTGATTIMPTEQGGSQGGSTLDFKNR